MQFSLWLFPFPSSFFSLNPTLLSVPAPPWQSGSCKQGSVGMSWAGGAAGAFSHPQALLRPRASEGQASVHPLLLQLGPSLAGGVGKWECGDCRQASAAFPCVLRRQGTGACPPLAPCVPLELAARVQVGRRPPPRPRPDGGRHCHRCVAPVSPARGGRPPAAGAPAAQTSKGAARFIV